AQLLKGFDAVCLSGGSRAPRDLDIEGRELAGVHFAMDYLVQSNRRVAGENIPADNIIDARGKRVVVIGGGDTGSDCLGTAHRQGASCVVQLEVMPRPPKQRSADSPWPQYPLLFKTSTSHEEGGERYWSVTTRRFMGDKGRVERLSCARVEFIPQDKGRPLMKEVAGSDFEIEADLVILAVGFVHPEHRGPIADLRLRLDKRGNVETDGNYMSSRRGVFSAGDMRRGQSLVVWAISEGRGAAEAIDRYLR
ncbi:MAG: FAD-dependent oxidoreductase, partial [Candidatus Omnitrophota bacterium]